MIYSSTAVGFYRHAGAPSWSVSPAPCCHCDQPQFKRLNIDIAFYRGKVYSLTDAEELFLMSSSTQTSGYQNASHVVEHVIKELSVPPWKITDVIFSITSLPHVTRCSW
jgi:hypothetical protein